MMRTFSARLAAAVLLVMLAYGVAVGWLFHHQAIRAEHEQLQRIAHGLAHHIVQHWPQIGGAASGSRSGATSGSDQAAREAVLAMLRVVNPAVQVYVLDADGTVAAYLGEPGMVQTPRVALEPIRGFLAGRPLPLRGTDPMGGSEGRLFSAAMFPPRTGDARPPGYLYVVLDRPGGPTSSAQPPSAQATLALAALGLVGALALAGFALLRLTRPLHQLARSMHAVSPGPGTAGGEQPTRLGDEVQALHHALIEMTERLARQQRAEREQAAQHRETLAGIAHDLRTPLTALHGHLEALADPAADDADSVAVRRQRLHAAAMQQSDKVRRLSQQLFELATLQAEDAVLSHERFRLDELVSDTVQKFELEDRSPPVRLAGHAPGRIEVAGDLQLVERAITNLIDNARRHAPGAAVQVRLEHRPGLAQVLVEDEGPGLPPAVHERLLAGASLREPPLPHPRGGMGGLGLAIAQRVAVLHGGRLHPLAKPAGGTCLCLELPAAA
jgi:signal transduction histidine kinase